MHFDKKREFETLVEQHKRVIHAACNKYCAVYNREDLVQDILYNAWKNFITFNNNCKFSTWLYNIARNVAVSTLRRLKAIPPILHLEEEMNCGVCYITLEEDELLLRQAERYSTVIENLQPFERDYFEMYLEGANYKDIEKATGIAENNLRVSINRIKKRLQLRYGK